MRVRFAPSPTGYLHVGGARTALFNYLLARKCGGTFVLRIEDTDQDRNKAEHVAAILDGMAWLGMTPDEGPFFQSDGFPRHRMQAELLLEAGYAYPIFADDFPEGEARPARPAIRDRTEHFVAQDMVAATLSSRMLHEPFAIAFKVMEGKIEWEDLVHGHMEFQSEAIEDFLLVRSDGVPLYNMACVSDDIAHGITHVLRGDDHIANTPKQILLYYALWHSNVCRDAKVPQFGHLPMILGPDGARLSKRHGATSVQQYREEGILPEAMTNFLALLGWNPGDDREILSFPELVEAFSTERILKKASIFDTTKLEWMSGKYFQKVPSVDLQMQLRSEFPYRVDEIPWHGLVREFQPRAKTFTELRTKILPFLPYREPKYDPATVEKRWKDPEEVIDLLRFIQDELERVPGLDWMPEVLEDVLRKCAELRAVGFGKVVHPLRLALTGVPDGCGIDMTLFLLGPELVRERIQAAIEFLNAGALV